MCRGPSTATVKIEGWGRWRRCDFCALQFVDPLSYEGNLGNLFDNAYKGLETSNDLQDFAYRLSERSAFLENPSLWFWTPAYYDVLDWLDINCSGHGTILDLGCGLGYFLHSLRGKGFNPVGVDIAETAVSLNRDDGFRVWHGSVDQIPMGWVSPEAIVSFFMFHHTPNPSEAIQNIRAKWPSARLAIAVYGPSNYSPSRSNPPRTLIRWSSAGLRSLLEGAGYELEMREYSSSGTEAGFLRPLGNLRKRIKLKERGIRVAKLIELGTLPRLMRPFVQHGYVLLALAKPLNGVGPDMLR